MTREKEGWTKACLRSILLAELYRLLNRRTPPWIFYSVAEYFSDPGRPGQSYLIQKQEKWFTLLLFNREESDTLGCNNNRRFS
jgi:hypothetical protein